METWQWFMIAAGALLAGGFIWIGSYVLHDLFIGWTMAMIVENEDAEKRKGE